MPVLGIFSAVQAQSAMRVNGTVQVTGVVDVVDNGKVDWTRGEVRALGTGLPPKNMPPAQARVMAREAAIVVAERNLAKIIHGIHLTSDTTVHNLALESDIITRRVEGFIRGATILREKAMPDGSYEVVMALNMYGRNHSLADTLNLGGRAEEFLTPPAAPAPAPLLPAPPVPETIVIPPAPVVTPTSPVQEAPPAEMNPAPVPVPAASPVPDVKPLPVLEDHTIYTGLVIDCRGLSVERSMCPRILDENGRDIWGTVELSHDLVEDKGIVSYYNSLEEATRGTRVGKQPLVIKAVRADGGRNFKTNAVVSTADAERILAANKRSYFLDKLAVAFLVD